MTKDPFAAYKLPACIVDSVKIELDGTPAVFTVRLPSSLDDEYQNRVMRELTFETVVDDVTGDVRSHVDPMKLQAVRKKVFMDTCILDAEGLPDGMSYKEFFDAYPLAAKAIFSVAGDQAMKADSEAQEALEKLKPSRSGKPSGQESSVNTTTS